jgi:hypothetical protein
MTNNRVLVLCRTRMEALNTSYALAKKENIQHRLRMSLLPVCIHPWVGACLSEYTMPFLVKKDFEELWKKEISGTGMEIISSDNAWELLKTAAGKKNNSIDLNKLRNELSKSKPLADFCYPDTGNCGPVIGTVHGSKGREAEIVHFLLPEEISEENNENEEFVVDYDEESRVLFVAATRGKNSLIVCDSDNPKFRKIKKGSGRIFKVVNRKKAFINVEIGLDGDLTAEGIAGTYFDPDGIREAQIFFKKIAGSDQITWIDVRNNNDNYELIRNLKGKLQILGLLNPDSFKKDLFIIRKIIYNGSGPRILPQSLQNLRIIGTRTIVQPSYQSSFATGLHDPWAKSGFLLAPIITGFPRTNYWWSGY